MSARPYAFQPEVVQALGRYARAEEELARRCHAARDRLQEAGACDLAAELDALGRRSLRRRQCLQALGLPPDGSREAGVAVRPEPSDHGWPPAGGAVPRRLAPATAAGRASVAGAGALAVCREVLADLEAGSAWPAADVLGQARAQLQEDSARMVGLVHAVLAWRAALR